MARVTSLDLVAGTPIPIPELGVEFHQPTLKQIAQMGESNFYQSLAVFMTKKEDYLAELEKRFENSPELLEEVKGRLAFMNNFQLVLSILDANKESIGILRSFLFVVFPNLSKCFIDEIAMILSFKVGVKEDGSPEIKQVIINEGEFNAIAEVVQDLFASEELNKSAFNPANDKAASIAAKIEARRAKVAAENGLDKKKTSMIATSISILSTIGFTPLDTILNYTLPQLGFQLDRAKQFVSYETQMTLGAFSGLKDVEIADWAKLI